MPDLTEASLVHLVLVCARTAGALLLAPVFGTAFVPWPLRILFVALFTWVLAPIVPAGGSDAMMDPLVLAGFGALEVCLGALMGWTASLVLHGVRTAGQLMDQELAFAGARPTEGMSLIETMQLLLGTVIFLLINGHHLFISAMHESFYVWPAGGAYPAEWSAGFAGTMLASVFTVAIKLAAPVVLVGLLVTIAVGIFARSFPKFQAMGLVMGGRALSLLVVLAMTFGGVVYLLNDSLHDHMNRWSAGIEEAG